MFEQLIEILKPHISERRANRIETVLAHRTNRIRLVFENLYDPHNGAACLRTAEAMGIQQIHVIEGYERFEFRGTISQGCDKWLTIHRHPTTAICVRNLRKAGYKLYAADLSQDSVPIEQLPLDQGPVAVVFGNEHRGVSPIMRRALDGSFILPIRGFTQSYNLSVSSAMTLFHLRHGEQLRGDLTELQKQKLYVRWLLEDVKGVDEILRRAGLERPIEEQLSI